MTLFSQKLASTFKTRLLVPEIFHVLNPTVQSSPASFQFTSAGDNNAFAALHLCPGYFLQTNPRSHQRSFQGCMQMIHIDDHLVDLKAVEQGLIGTFENVSLDMCAIIDRYVSQKL